MAHRPPDYRVNRPWGRIVLRLEVDSGDQEPVSGLVCVAGEPDREFSGWSELFAVLQTVLARTR